MHATVVPPIREGGRVVVPGRSVVDVVVGFTVVVGFIVVDVVVGFTVVVGCTVVEVVGGRVVDDVVELVVVVVGGSVVEVLDVVVVVDGTHSSVVVVISGSGRLAQPARHAPNAVRHCATGFACAHAVEHVAKAAVVAVRHALSP